MTLNHLTISEWYTACTMWRRGCDTFRIAERLDCPEALIYNRLPVYRAKWAGIFLETKPRVNNLQSFNETR